MTMQAMPMLQAFSDLFSPGPVLSLALTVLLLAATIYDVAKFRIPNIIPLLVTGLFLLKVSAGIEAGPVWPTILVAACTLALGFIAFTAGVLGGGDVKLMASLALWFDASAFADFIAITGMVGGGLGVGLLVARRFIPVVPQPTPTDLSTLPYKQRLLNPAAPLPYALPISIAALSLEWL